MTKIDISQEKIDCIIKVYNSGKTTHQVAKECGYSQTFILNTLKRNNVPIRPIYSYTRKYNINEHFFDVIDAEDKAYFLGLMFADGNNYRSEETGKGHDYQISIKLQEEDKHILDTFVKIMSSNLELKYSKPKNEKWKNGWLLKFDSKIVSDQLKELGCVPAKSLILKYPVIPDHLQNHFLRGYFDGDGGVSTWEKKWKTTTNVNYNLKITSSKMFCIAAKQVIQSNIDVNMYLFLPKANNENQITTSLGIGGNQQVYKLMTWLYKDSTIFLKRKHDKYLELKAQLEI
jgi:hypothetical protein